jgi:hypothetical protein
VVGRVDALVVFGGDCPRNQTAAFKSTLSVAADIHGLSVPHIQSSSAGTPKAEMGLAQGTASLKLPVRIFFLSPKWTLLLILSGIGALNEWSSYQVDREGPSKQACWSSSSTWHQVLERECPVPLGLNDLRVSPPLFPTGHPQATYHSAVPTRQE